MQNPAEPSLSTHEADEKIVRNLAQTVNFINWTDLLIIWNDLLKYLREAGRHWTTVGWLSATDTLEGSIVYLR